MKRAILLGVLALLAVAATARQTQADQVWDFSFTNTAGFTAGTVTGDIVLPFNGDGSGAATHVFIDSYPAGLGNIGTPPLDATTWTTQLSNDFTVSLGQIFFPTTFQALNGPSPDSATVLLQISTGQLVDIPAFGLVLGRIVYTPEEVTSTPEPASVTLLISGFLAAGGVHFVRRRRTGLLST